MHALSTSEILTNTKVFVEFGFKSFQSIMTMIYDAQCSLYQFDGSANAGSVYSPYVYSLPFLMVRALGISLLHSQTGRLERICGFYGSLLKYMYIYISFSIKHESTTIKT